MAVTPCEQGWYELRFKSAGLCIGWILPEIINLAVGMGAKAGAVCEPEVVFQNGGNQSGKARVSGKGCEVKGVLTIAIRLGNWLFGSASSKE